MLHARLVYERLGVLLTDDDRRGESAYNDDLLKVINALKAKGLLSESEGAQCVFLKGPDGKPLFVNKEGEPLPLIVQKSDEGYLYATTDLAAIAFRTGYIEELADGKSPHADRILYVVDARQALHFRMVFECAYQAEFAERGKHELEHVAFGTMMGPDGKPFRTREGGTVKLMDLLDEAEKRALDLVTQKNAEDVALCRAQPLSDDQKKDIARKVGIGAVKYADLAQNRTSDYVFSWEKMLSLAGNTAPYMQYAYARVRSIFRKAGLAAAGTAAIQPIPLEAPEELALGKMLLRFPETLDRALDGYQPNVLAAYLYDLAQAFTAFYEACPVLKSEAAVRAARLKLCDLVARTIAKGLDLLGIEVADRM
jgi:arginyl-tRNA synthetase